MLDTPTPGGARILARIRTKFQAQGLASTHAHSVLAAIRAADTSPDDLSDSDLVKLGRAAADLAKSGADAETMAAELARVLAEIMAPETERPDTGQPGVGPAEAAAIMDLVSMHNGTIQQAREFVASGKSLGDVIAHYRSKGAPLNRIGAGIPAQVSGGRGAQTLEARMSRGLAASVDARIDPGAGREFVGHGLGALAMHFARARGITVFNESGALSAVMGSHSSSDFISTVVGPAVDLTLGMQYQQIQPEILRAARQVERDNYRDWSAVRMGAGSELTPVGEGGEFPFTTLDDEGQAGPIPGIRARIFRVTEQAIRNDRLSILGDAGRFLAQGAAETVRRGLAGVLTAGGAGQIMRDGNPLFHTSHGNLLTGAASALSLTSLAAAGVLLRRQTGPGGESLAIPPRFLIVPPELEVPALKLVADIDATRADDVNVFAGRLEVLVEPGLAGAEWYLAADPATADGLAMSYVDSPGPRVDQQIGWDRAVIEFRVRFDVGFGALDWRGLVKSAGA
jgi:hypothetical protein